MKIGYNAHAVNHGPSRLKAALRAAAACSLLVGSIMFPGLSGANAAVSPAPVGLGTATTYSVLGGTTVTNTGPTTLSGDLGVNPGTAVTGFPPGIFGGVLHAADAPALQAQSDLTVAFDDAAGRASTALVSGDLVGQTLVAGVYKSATTVDLSGTLTLDGQGDPSSVFIFQVGSALTTASASTMNLINGASACNVYWQVGSSATLGTGSHFKGTIMSLSSISATTGATVEGRALARKGQVSLDTNVFTTPVCAAPVVAPVVVAPSPVAVVPAPSASASASAPVVAPLNSAPVSAIPVVAAPVALSPDATTPTNDAAPAGEVSGDTVQQQQLADTGATPNSRLFLAAGAALLAAGAGILLFKRFAPRFSRRH